MHSASVFLACLAGSCSPGKGYELLGGGGGGGGTSARFLGASGAQASQFQSISGNHIRGEGCLEIRAFAASDNNEYIPLIGDTTHTLETTHMVQSLASTTFAQLMLLLLCRAR